jgi:hypothetical protein
MFDEGTDRLRAWIYGGPIREVVLTDRFSVGSGTTCDLSIPQPGLRPLHFVIERLHDEWVLSCFGGAEVKTEAGGSARRLPLSKETQFSVGIVHFELACAAPPKRTAGTINGRCATCGYEVHLLAVRARFCPKCGVRVQEPEALGVKPVLPVEPNHSEILNGYASALTHLGGKYEENRPRNEREAVRCYLKAAKLGSGAAHEKLAEKGIEPAAPETPTDGDVV